MLNLFSTSSDTAGFRLDYMEIYNWGTFHERIFRLAPQGNNALLTGANASGKSTIIDALLTLLVPAKKDRFYNQSSGVEKKGNRTEETYVLGHYGNIQKEGERGVTTQALRDKSAYSVLLASFSNTDQRVVTIFQVRWFSGGELRRSFGLAHVPLEIQKDFQPFDGKGVWRRRLEASYKGARTLVEFFDGPVGYAERITQLFGMRSVKALSLFNQIVGVKVLDDLDEFIRINMLEEHDAEAQYLQLKDSFTTLIDAKVNIEKARTQIEMLQPIASLASQIESADERLHQLMTDKDTAVYWFAKQLIDLAKEKLDVAMKEKEKLETDIAHLRQREEKLKQEERTLSLAIEKDEVGRKLKELETDIERLSKVRNERMASMDTYNELASKSGFSPNPDEKTFNAQRAQAAQQIEEWTETKETCIRKQVQTENEQKKLAQQVEELVHTVEMLQKNKNNIPLRETEIRDAILAHTGASKEEIPFVGELCRVAEDEKEWEIALEKILHHFALHLIVPDKYYHQVNEYVNTTNLKGRVMFYRYTPSGSLAGMQTYQLSAGEEGQVIDKIEIRPDSEYEEWVRDMILEKYNYTCADTLSAFERYREKVVTREGLVKFAGERHEKDDRPHILRRENFVLGWENKEKIRLLQQELLQLQEQDATLAREIDRIRQEAAEGEARCALHRRLVDLFPDFKKIDWQSFVGEIQRKQEEKEALEKGNDHLHTLQTQLENVHEEQHRLSVTDIPEHTRKMIHAEYRIEQLQREIDENQRVISSIRSLLFTDFEKNYAYLCELSYDQLKQERGKFQAKNERERKKLETEKRGYEDEAKVKITAFKHPDEDILTRFKDWRADVDTLPDATHIELIDAYRQMLERLEKENLPKYEKQFDGYLQKTLTDKVGEFRMFFINWMHTIKSNIDMLNDSLKAIDYRMRPVTYIQLTALTQISEEASEFRRLMDEAVPNVQKINATSDGRRIHFYEHVEPFMSRLADEEWRAKVMDVRFWFTYKAEEFNRQSGHKETTYENMGHLSGGEKAQLTYTILGSAIAYQFGLTKSGLQNDSFRFVAIDEAFKAQDEDKARYLITLCKQLHLQLLVVTPNDNIHIVENDISYVYFVERKEEKTSWLYSMPIEQWKRETHEQPSRT